MCGPVAMEWESLIKTLTTSGIFLSDKDDSLEWTGNFSTGTVTACNTYLAVSEFSSIQRNRWRLSKL